MRLLAMTTAAMLIAGAALAEGAATQITKTEFGILTKGLIGPPKYTPAKVIDSSKDKACGWAIWVKTDKEKVHIREQVTLPSPAPAWNSDAHTKVNATHTVGVTERDVAPKEGMVSGVWGVAPSDPKGHYVMRVSIDSLPERVFEFDVK